MPKTQSNINPLDESGLPLKMNQLYSALELGLSEEDIALLTRQTVSIQDLLPCD